MGNEICWAVARPTLAGSQRAASARKYIVAVGHHHHHHQSDEINAV